MDFSTTKKTDELDKIKNRVVNDVYLGVILLTIPLIISNIHQIMAIGISPVGVFSFFSPIVLIVLFLLRHKTSYKLRAHVAIGLTYVTAIADLLSVGMLSVGSLLLLIACIFAAIFLDNKKVIFMLFLTSLTITVIAILIVTEIINFDFDANKFMGASSSWVIYIVTYILLTLTITMGIRRLNRFNEKFAIKLQLQNEELSASRKILHESESSYRSLVENINDFIYTLDKEGHILSVNEKSCKILMRTREEIIGSFVYDFVPDESFDHSYIEFFESVVKDKVTKTEFFVIDTVVYGEVTYEITLIPIMTEGKIEKIIGNNHDVTEISKKEKVIEKLAFEDTLTGLPNRVRFRKYVTDRIEIRAGTEESFAVCFFDLDNFKKINDSVGHIQGDIILKEVASRLKKSFLDTAYYARVSGDEFAMVYDINENTRTVETMVQQIQRIFSQPFILNQVEYNLTSSIGVTCFPSDGEITGELLKNADTALYEAKVSGRNKYRLFDTKLKKDLTDRIEMERELSKALNLGEISVNYQPQYDKNHQIIGFEALMRWNSAVFGSVSPNIFIPILEESGKIIQFGEWILFEALCTLKTFHAESKKPLRMSVNISSVQFQSPYFIENIKQILKDVNVEPKYLELEVTESILINDFDGVLRILEDLRSIGISIALDDFGTGYSSLNYLRKLPITVLKIDKSFVDDINDKDEDVIVGSVIQLSHSLGLEVVAEGIEHQSQSEYLIKNECDYQQGFYLSRPLTEEKALKLLQNIINI